jgi:hypothetical protein
VQESRRRLHFAGVDGDETGDPTTNWRCQQLIAQNRLWLILTAFHFHSMFSRPVSNFPH